jgi:type II secretory pathway pseudopilin PulG
MKKGIALIELIFAIVIMGIALVSVPNLIAITSKSSNEAFTQEAISSGFSYMGMILSQYWDEKLTDEDFSPTILYVKSGDSELEEAKDNFGNPLGRRVGSPLSTSRRFAKDINGVKIFAADMLSQELSDDNSPDDVDDFNNKSFTLVNNEVTDPVTGDYKDTAVIMSIKVNYISDETNYNSSTVSFNNPFLSSKIAISSTNIKSIEIFVTSPNDPNRLIIFKGFSCNIGATEIKERLF